ncbi:MAG: FAD-dependent oxidoreductase [Chloroflexi bacterium]|nr:FAD-dependent oxidoreductase [Chloroflexota bacterium]
MQRQVPVVEDADVLVIGGGPAGIGAAVAAARNGVKTILVEQYGFLGGAATAALVGPFMTSYSADGETQIIGGVFDELVRRMEALGGATHPGRVRAGSAEAGFYRFGHDHVTPFESETLKLVAAEMALESGVRLWLHTRFIEPLMEGRWVRGAIVHNKSGLQAIAARVVVDCTADADVAYLAGAPTLKGRPEDGLTQPMTMFFRVGGVDDKVVEAYAAAHPEEEGRLFHSLVEEGKARGAFTIARDKIGVYRTTQPGVWRVNTSRMQRLDGTNAAHLTEAEIVGRRQVAELMRFLRDSAPGFEHATLLDTGAQVGVRETRRIVGEHVLSIEDLATPRHFEDVVALGSFPVDLHPEIGDGGGTDTGRERGFVTAPVYEVPYRSLVPMNVEQLLVAGRCLSATREALAAVRIMPMCFATGQAAGVGAALAVQDETSPRRVSVARLRQVLQGQGAILSAS